MYTGDSSQLLNNRDKRNYTRGDIMLGIIDRFEGHFAVVEMEDGNMENILISKIPINAKEGYVLNLDEHITINYEETKSKQSTIEKLIKDMWK